MRVDGPQTRLAPTREGRHRRVGMEICSGGCAMGWRAAALQPSAYTMRIGAYSGGAIFAAPPILGERVRTHRLQPRPFRHAGRIPVPVHPTAHDGCVVA